MLNIAIVDDEPEIYQQLMEYFNKYGEETGDLFNINYYDDGMVFLETYKYEDVVLMDINMKFLDGMSTAKKLREIDNDVVLIFVTNMVQYAIKGYSVRAFDYILKPMRYQYFSIMIRRVIAYLNKNSSTKILLNLNGDFKKKLLLSSIMFVEVRDHLLVYHSAEETVEVWGTLKEEMEKLPSDIFVRCHNSFVVNLKYVTSAEKNELVLNYGQFRLPISRSRKEIVLSGLNKYLRTK